MRTERPSREELEAMGERIAAGQAAIDAATHGLVTLLRAFDTHEGWAAQGALSCAQWLSWRTGLLPGAAREKVRVARALGGLPALDAAFARGEVSYSKLRAVTRVATADNEALFCQLAREMTAAELERTCRRLEAAAPKTAEREAQTAAVRGARLRPGPAGTVVLEVALSADEAALCEKALRVSAETRNPADGLLALCEAALRGERPAGGPRRPEEETADAEADKERATGTPAELVVHVDAALQGVTEGGQGLAPATVRRLLCDAGVVPLAVGEQDGATAVLGVGRKRRTLPVALRRALLARDRGCRFPGCSNRLHVDGHHLEHWVDGGETSLANTVLLCRRHHRAVHELGFSLRTAADGGLEFRDPQGRVLTAVLAAGPGTRPEPLASFVAPGCALPVSAETPRADPERPDYPWILDLLYDATYLRPLRRTASTATELGGRAS